MTASDLVFSLLNFEAGGLCGDGVHRFDGLVRAFMEDPQPDVIVLCEGKEWHRDGRAPFLAAIRELRTALGRPYVGELHAGALPTAIVFDPAKLSLVLAEDTRYPDRQGRARFALQADASCQFDIRAEHWSYSSSRDRFTRAQRLAQYGRHPVPILIMGDMNESASGPDYPDLDWEAVPIAVRDYVGRRDDHGIWGRQTAALDRLIGAYDPSTGARIDAAGFHSVAELDPEARRPFLATSNVRNLHVDHCLANDALLRSARVVAGSYRVHVPTGRDPAYWPSDHRRISFTLRFTGPVRADREAR